MPSGFSKEPKEKWYNKPFTKYEWALVVTTWKQLVDQNKIIFDDKSKVMTNVQTLCTALRTIDKAYKNHLEHGLKS